MISPPRLLWIALLGLILPLSGCVHNSATAGFTQDRPLQPGRGYFQNVTEAIGLTFRYDNDATPQRRFIETTGGGCAFLDYDNDGYLDIFAVQGGPAPGSPNRPRPPHALYRNLGGKRFQDITAKVGLAVDTGYAQGVAAADYDNDGWTDLLITTYGGVHLFRNQRGHFTEVTRHAGLIPKGEAHWATSAAWADFDRDGYLDLFVCHYASWFPDNERPCFDHEGQPMYCAPTQYAGDMSRLYRNRGNGTFENVSHRAGLDKKEGKAMGAAWLDYDADGWPDLCVANDMSPNWLLRNNHDGSFREVAYETGVAYGPGSQPLSGMGIAIADFNDDLQEDIFIVNFSLQPRTYLLNSGKGLFLSQNPASGIGGNEQPFLAFGVEALDYDLDGHIDLVLGNGHINDSVDKMGGSVTYRQRQQLLHNIGGGLFRDEIAAAGDLANPRLTRGLAVGDFDNDGHPDCLMSGPGEPLALFRNIGTGNHWIGFRLEGKQSNRDGIGAHLTLTTKSSTQRRTVRSGSSYCAHSDSRLLFGLGSATQAEQIEVVWPSGKRYTPHNLSADRYYLLREDGSCQPQ